MPYEVGDIVIFRPKWPNKPAFGIWTSDTDLVTEGKTFRISSISGTYSEGTLYYGQFDPKEDGTFHSAHWPAWEHEIIGPANPGETP